VSLGRNAQRWERFLDETDECPRIGLKPLLLGEGNNSRTVGGCRNAAQQRLPVLVGGRLVGQHEKPQDSHDGVASRANCVAVLTIEVAFTEWNRFLATFHAQRSRKGVGKLPSRRWPAPSRQSLNSNPQHPQRKPNHRMKRKWQNWGGWLDDDRRTLDGQISCKPESIWRLSRLAGSPHFP